jgi:hypothetical protein
MGISFQLQVYNEVNKNCIFLTKQLYNYTNFEHTHLQTKSVSNTPKDSRFSSVPFYEIISKTRNAN